MMNNDIINNIFDEFESEKIELKIKYDENASRIDIINESIKELVEYDDDRQIFSPRNISGINSEKIEELKNELVSSDDDKLVATGYGRVSVDKADKTVTEISCHALGACKIFNKQDLVIIDIGGQDTKVINVEEGLVKDFIMNDKCSAGTGRFLDVMAKTMELSIDELCEMAKDGGGVSISSLCTVFAESEVISLIGKSENKD